ncbi:MAG: hypothetical protein EBY37_01725 [Flavobacteriia bacterium]|nr:hypothetical protein [Flavobacteriia bacterium]
MKKIELTKEGFMKKISLYFLSSLFLITAFLACSKENSKEELFLDKVDEIVWTRGSNYKSFKGNPFKLIIVEDGICLEYREGDTIVRENKFSYNVQKNTPDTLELGYRVQGEKINHCGTFTYYLDEDQNLIRIYKECNASIFGEAQRLSYYKSEKAYDEICLDP